MAKIFIVEDDQRTALLIRDNLQAIGHTCVTLTSSAHAIEAARAENVDLAILDVMMPGGQCGFELCRRLRADSQLYALPILLLSAMTGDEEIMHGLAQGADDYMKKPFAVQNLLQRVAALLRANADADAPDEITSLLNANTTKREVQKRVSRQDVFALACAELVYLREFAYKCGADARLKAIRHLARALSRCGKDIEDDTFAVGHMGGGHFITIVSPAQIDRYCKHVARSWKAHLPALYESLGLTRKYEEAVTGKVTGEAIPLLEPLICVTTRHPHDAMSSQEMFDVLIKIRSNALATGGAGIHVDRRS
ncbi:MAG: response regulator [Nitrospiraceae bacterium]|nr:response regulator [Nitrospiraceae bacterium]